MPVHQNVNILHGHVGLNAVQHAVVVKNHVIVNVTAQMDIHQISAKTMVNAMVNQEKKRTAIRTLNVHQNANSVRTGSHGCPAQKLAEAVPRADRRNANARNGSIWLILSVWNFVGDFHVSHPTHKYDSYGSIKIELWQMRRLRRYPTNRLHWM